MNLSKRTRILLFIGYFCLAEFYCLFTNARFPFVVLQSFYVAMTFTVFFPLWPKRGKSR